MCVSVCIFNQIFTSSYTSLVTISVHLFFPVDCSFPFHLLQNSFFISSSCHLGGFLNGLPFISDSFNTSHPIQLRLFFIICGYIFHSRHDEDIDMQELILRFLLPMSSLLFPSPTDLLLHLLQSITPVIILHYFSFLHHSTHSVYSVCFI